MSRLASVASVPTAHAQCVLVRKDETASVRSNNCASLRCAGESLPRKPPGSTLPDELFPDSLDAGPALDGTACDTEYAH